MAALAIKHENNLYQMMFQLVTNEEAYTAGISNLRLWHERFGHIGLKSLREKKDVVDIGPIPQDINFFSEAYQYGK